MPKRNRKPEHQVTVDNKTVTIKDVVVADPSVEFSIALDPLQFKPDSNGVYLRNLTIQISISGLNGSDKNQLRNVGQITVNTLTQLRAYFYMTFGDINYKSGTKYTLCLLLSAYDPFTGAPVEFKDNPVKLDVYGGGVVS